MPVCPSCHRDVASPGRFCPECGASWAAPAGRPNETVARETVAVSPPPDSRPPSSHPSSSSLHGRFDPGTRLGSRYRIVGLLGRGGMGEVYRADDLELNQSVALKFLPERVARNAADLARLRSEVRTARQISHPNVCRTYDISEAGDQVFVVMEYVDGEDLASVLRRLGRPSPDKALEIARQLCLGLGAAHENGVLHRDLKPANIMIDGRGRVRITDFGLAGTAEEIAAEGAIAGTPAYMAPEQLRSGGGSQQSDIYSLGLVLYEVFTGKKVLDMTPRPDPSRRGPTDSSVTTPSSIVANIDPAVERVILRCLEHDPSRRPQSAYAVYGALPGGDPLAAAVAAGETPSPELVANAGVEGSVRPLHAGLAVVIALSGFFLLSVLNRPHLTGLERSPQVLSVKAEEILTQVTGTNAPRFSGEGFARAAASDSTARRVPMYWRRWSPLMMTSENLHNPGIGLTEPPQTYPGSGTVLLSPAGRLLALRIMPDLRPDTTSAARIDWAPVLRAAGADPVTMTPSAVPDSFLAVADTVAAWRLSRADAPETTLAAAALHGRIIEANTFARGRPLANLEARPVENDPEGVVAWIQLFIFTILPIVGGLILARHNLKVGRSDIRGALVVGTSILSLYLIEYLFTTRASELGLYRIVNGLTWQNPIGHALIHGATMAIAYLAIEPYIRRLWPSVLVSWARLVAGRWRDPIVGRDVLAGAVWGIAGCLLLLGYETLSRSMGLVSEPYQLSTRILSEATATRLIFATAANSFALSMLYATMTFTLLVALRFVLRKNLLAVIAMVLLLSIVNTPFAPKTFALNLAFALLWTAMSVVVALRFGYVALIVSWAVNLMAERLPWTTDFGAWFAPQLMLAWVMILALLAYGFMTAVGGRSLFRDPLSDPVIGGKRAV
jgi:hypothetical protein